MEELAEKEDVNILTYVIDGRRTIIGLRFFSCISKDVLAILASTIAYEFTFSTESSVIEFLIVHWLKEMVEVLTCSLLKIG